MIKKVCEKFKQHGIRGVVRAVFRLVSPRCFMFWRHCRLFLKSKIGLEIGGPSKIFGRRGLIPVYTVADRVDNCNFGNNTMWEGEIKEGDTFYFDKRRGPGYQYVAEASDLNCIKSASYDFVLSSHCLEHIANPLQALAEWTRVLKDEGVLVLIVPNKDGIFDHRRTVTSLEHLIQDFDRKTMEDDMTHLEEILELHDIARDPGLSDLQELKQRSMLNPENRCLHHHVFDIRLAVEVVRYVGLKILLAEVFYPYHIVVIAQKTQLGE